MNPTPPEGFADGRPPLRVGLVIDGLRQPAWVARLVEGIEASTFATVTLVLRPREETSPRHPPSGPWLFRAYTRLDRRLYGGQATAFRSVNLEPLLVGCSTRTIPREVAPGPEDREALREAELDVIIRIGTWEPEALDLEVAREGIWSVEESTSPDVPCRDFWSVVRGDPVMTTAVRCRGGATGRGGERIVERASSIRDRRSWVLSQDARLWKASALLLRRLARCHAGAVDDDTGGPHREVVGEVEGARAVAPGSGDVLVAGHLARMAGRFAVSTVRRRLVRDQWCLGYRWGEGGPITAEDLAGFQLLVPPPDRFWADPFVVERDGRHLVFVEEALYGAGKGHLSVMEMDEAGGVTEPVKILERDYHLSYPFVFEHEGDWFMIPETVFNETIEVYRCRRFPHEWELDRVMMSGVRGCDATLCHHEGRWWMFVALTEAGPLHSDELFLYHGPTPFGPWTPHRRNPVVSDGRRARPGGRVFEWQGALYRPAQDCSVRYGYALTLNRIDRLSPDGFEETPVARLTPGGFPGGLGIHTFNRAGRLAMIDLRRRRWSLGR